MRSRVTTAVITPPAHSMHAAPGRVLEDLDLVSRGVFVQVFPIIRYPGQALLLDVRHRLGERHVTVTMVMTVGLPVSGDVDHLIPVTGIGEGRHQAVRETLATVEQP